MRWLVDRPVLLRRQRDARAIGAAALVAAAEGRSRGPGGGYQFGDRQAGVGDLLLQRVDVARFDQRVVHGRDRVLPDQFFLGHFRAEVARARSHVAVGQLEPGAGEGIGERLRVLEEAPGNRPVDGVEAQRQVGGEHLRPLFLRRVVRVRHVFRRVLGHPLVGAGRRLLQLPLEAEQVLEELVAPQRRGLGPGDLQAGGDGVGALAAAMAVGPAQPLQLEVGRFGLDADVLGAGRAVGLAEGVAAGDQGHGLLVVHRHAAEGIADVLGRQQRVGIAVRAFRVHVDQAHLHRGQRVLQVAGVPDHAVVVLDQHAVLVVHAGRAARIALVAAQPLGLAAPVHVQVRLPGVLAAGAEAEGAEAHRLQRDVAGQDHQVGPGNLLAVLLLDRPQQAARLVQADVVRPAVERGEALLAAAAAAAAIADAVGAGAVPGHADHQPAVMAEVGRPPVLRIGHQRAQVLLQLVVVELLELGGVVELAAQGVGSRGVLVEQVQAQLVGPPEAVAGAAAGGGVVDRALVLGRHGIVPWFACAPARSRSRPGTVRWNRLAMTFQGRGCPPLRPALRRPYVCKPAHLMPAVQAK